MQNVPDKYFWDGKENISDDFVIRRMLEYAAFPDLLKLSFDNIKNYLMRVNPEQLRTSEKRKEFLKVIQPYLETSDSFEDAVFQMVEDYFAANYRD